MRLRGGATLPAVLNGPSVSRAGSARSGFAAVPPSGPPILGRMLRRLFRRRRPAGRRSAVVSYAPHADGLPDPGEVVWGWVPFEDDPRQGSVVSRPVTATTLDRTDADLRMPRWVVVWLVVTACIQTYDALYELLGPLSHAGGRLAGLWPGHVFYSKFDHRYAGFDAFGSAQSWANLLEVVVIVCALVLRRRFAALGQDVR